MWYVYYDGERYKFTNTTDVDYLASFKVFDMAYAYVCHMNNVNLQTYSRWTR